MRLEKYDLLLVRRTNSLLGKIIKAVLRSDYSHVAIYMGNYHVIDTDFFKNVSLHEMNTALGDFDVYRLRCTLTKSQEAVLDDFFLKTLNTQYDFLEALGTWLKLNIGLQKRFICISLATEAFKRAGITIDETKKDFEKLTKNLCFEKIID